MAEHIGDAIDTLAETIADNNENKGFWEISEPDHIIPIKIALMHTELSEALDVHHQTYDDDAQDPVTNMTPMQEDDLTEELADAVIRILDLAGYYELPIGEAIVAKVEKNLSRPHKHNKRY